ncbi:hypothetical protein NVP1031O_179 [Vibrio phage 1.031.O._10N.261.46.F8]|nr:hypothetical protein NVP1031O_179 [Vibrio phage 1.031.O._10N.261.46.F8]
MATTGAKLLEICEAILTNPDYEGERLSDESAIQVTLGKEDVKSFSKLAQEAGLTTKTVGDDTVRVYVDADTADDSMKAINAIDRAQSYKLEARPVNLEGWHAEPGE